MSDTTTQVAQPRNGGGSYAAPEPDLARAEALIETGTGRHRDDADKVQHLKAHDRRRDQWLERLQRRHADIQRELDECGLILRHILADDVPQDVLLASLQGSQAEAITEHKEASGILEQRQRGRVDRRLEVNVGRDRQVVINAD